MQVSHQDEFITHAVIGGKKSMNFGISDDPAFFQRAGHPPDAVEHLIFSGDSFEPAVPADTFDKTRGGRVNNHRFHRSISRQVFQRGVVLFIRALFAGQPPEQYFRRM